jgi:hypothetical protein
MARAAVLAVAAVILVMWLRIDFGRLLPTPASINGYPAGDKLCDGAKAVSEETADYICAGVSGAAVGMLKPGHAAVVSNETYADRYAFYRTYGSGHAQGIVALKLTDGTTHAFFIGCVVGPFGAEGPSVSPNQCDLMTPMEGEKWSPPPGANVK